MTPFGTTVDGRAVDKVTISGHGLTVHILTYGAIVQGVFLDGVAYNLTLGSSRVADYEGEMRYHGAIVGPVANRITGGKITVLGKTHQLTPNLEDGHTLHGGGFNTQSKIWKIDEQSENSAVLSLHMPDGEGGYPADRATRATFEVCAGPALRLTIATTSDAPSVVNMTNHSYWNLDGTDHTRDHTLRIDAAHYLPSDGATFPTGDVAPVDATPYDFRGGKTIDNGSPPLDTTFCVADDRRALTECAWLRGASGISMAVATTEPGIHIYDAAATHRPDRPPCEGFAIEAQGWPDAPTHAHFPDISIGPDAPVTQVTEWRFKLG